MTQESELMLTEVTVVSNELLSFSRMIFLRKVSRNILFRWMKHERVILLQFYVLYLLNKCFAGRACHLLSSPLPALWPNAFRGLLIF